MLVVIIGVLLIAKICISMLTVKLGKWYTVLISVLSGGHMDDIDYNVIFLYV